MKINTPETYSRITIRVNLIHTLLWLVILLPAFIGFEFFYFDFIFSLIGFFALITTILFFYGLYLLWKYHEKYLIIIGISINLLFLLLDFAFFVSIISTTF